MCWLSTLYPEDIEEVSPFTPRVPFLEKIKEKLAESSEIALKKKRKDAYCLAGVSAPTGTGKTTFLTALAVASVIQEGAKVTILTPTKEARAEVLARLLEAVSNVIKNGGTPPKILVMYSKLDTCISNHPKIREVMEQLAEEERKPEPDTNTITKLSKLFYSRCSNLVRQKKCPFYNNAQDRKLVRNLLDAVKKDSLVYIIGSITEETKKIIEREAPTYMELAKEMGVELPYVADIKTLSKTFKVCPYEIAKYLAPEVDIIVLDSIYLSSIFSARTVPILSEALNPDRLLLIDETHELFRNTYPSIEISEDSRLYNLNSIKSIIPVLEEIIEKYKVDEASMELSNGDRVDVAVPPDKLDDEYISTLLSAVKKAEREMRNIKTSKRDKLLLESEVSILKESILLEKHNFRVSENARRGILAFMKIREEGKVKYYIIPVILSRKLKHGREYDTVIHFSATLLPVQLTLLHAIPTKITQEVIAPLKWDIIEKNRKTAIVRTRAYMKEREQVTELIKELVLASGKEKVLVIATTSWKLLLENLANEIGYKYYTPRLVKSQEEREREANRIRDIIHKPGKLLLHISPHTSFGVAVNLADKDKPLDVLVIGASESILPPTSETNAEASVISRKYDIKWFNAWFTVNVNRAILKTIQTAGRLQRSEKHKIDLVLIGRYFDKTLAKFYEPVFGGYDIVYDRDEIDIPEIVESVKRYMGW